VTGAGILEPDDMPPGEVPALTEADLEEFIKLLDGLEVKPELVHGVIVHRQQGFALDVDEIVGVMPCDEDGYGVAILSGGGQVETPFAANTLLEFWLENTPDARMERARQTITNSL